MSVRRWRRDFGPYDIRLEGGPCHGEVKESVLPEHNYNHGRRNGWTRPHPYTYANGSATDDPDEVGTYLEGQHYIRNEHLYRLSHEAADSTRHRRVFVYTHDPSGDRTFRGTSEPGG